MKQNLFLSGGGVETPQNRDLEDLYILRFPFLSHHFFTFVDERKGRKVLEKWGFLEVVLYESLDF